jgi:hypothetical protein
MEGFGVGDIEYAASAITILATLLDTASLNNCK